MKLEDTQKLSDEELEKLSKEQLILILKEYIERGHTFTFDDSKIKI